MAAGSRPPGRNPGAGLAGIMYKTGGSRIPGYHPGAGPRDERRDGHADRRHNPCCTYSAALVVWGQASRGNRFSQRTANGRDEVPNGDLGHPRDEVPDSGLGHPIAVPEMAVSSRESGSRAWESVREENRHLEVRVLPALSPGPVLPQFSDRAASAVSTQVSHRVEVGAELRANMALQVGRQVEDEERTDDRAGSGSGSRDEWEYDVPQGGTALVRVQPVIGTVMAPSMSDHPSDESLLAFHSAGGGGTHRLVVHLQLEVQMRQQRMDYVEVCWA